MKSQGKRARKEERIKEEDNQKTFNKMKINTYQSIITLKVNGLSAPVKTHRVAEWIKKENPSICCL